MKTKIILLLMLANLPFAYAQTQWRLEAFWEYFGHTRETYVGSRVKGFVGSLANNPYNVAVASGSSRAPLPELRFYSIGSPNDTIPRWIITGGADVEHGDFNGDGFTDFAVWKSLDFGYYDTVLVYLGKSGGIDKTPVLKLSAEKERTDFGQSMCVGDLNNDRIDDLVITAADYYQDFEGQGYGKVYGYFGGNSLKSAPAFTITGSHPAAHLGVVCAIGDFTNDKFNDLAILGYDFAVREASFGYLNVYSGSAKFDTVADLTGPRSYLNNVNDITAFDANGDRKTDLIWAFLDSSTFKRSVFIHYGGLDFQQRFPMGPDFIIPAPAGSGEFGNEIINAGDMNGDGDDDLVIAAYTTGQNNGIVFVYTAGKALDDRFDAARGQTLDGAFGSSVSSAGDINKDGYSEIIVGAPNQPFLAAKGYFGIFLGDPRIPTRVAAGNEEKTPTKFILHPIYPNPFKHETIFEFSLSQPALIEIKVFNILGTEMRSFLSDEHLPGQYKILWNGKNDKGEVIPDGVYFCRMQAITSNDPQTVFQQTQKFTVVR